MKTKFYMYCLLLLILYGCFNKNKKASDYELNESERSSIRKTIDSMYRLDQGIRFKLIALDSAYGINFNNYHEKVDLLGKNFGIYKSKKDSIINLMNNIDDANTEKLIELTRKYGFPNNKRLNEYKSKSYFIFVHSSQKFSKEIRKLILKEYNEGRITEYKKEYIFWNINGRNGMPPMSGENGEAIWINNQI